MAIAMKTGKTRLAGRLPQSQADDAKEANMSQETEKPKNLRANTLPTDGFVAPHEWQRISDGHSNRPTLPGPPKGPIGPNDRGLVGPVGFRLD